MENNLVLLGEQLRVDAYSFVTPSPATHARVLERPQTKSDLLRKIFGWNSAFSAEDLPAAYQRFLETEIFCGAEGKLRSAVRFSTLDGLLLAHSPYPTVERDAVFFGPDTYRFCRAIKAICDREPDFRPQRIVDVGAGTGAGGFYAAQQLASLTEIVLADINPHAVSFCRANAILNKIVGAQAVLSDLFADVQGDADFIVSNPPYLVDHAHRAYRDGGGTWGDSLAVQIVEQALDHLRSEGQLLIYTGTPVVDGRDMFFETARQTLDRRLRSYHYEEIDPDVFGEELARSPYDRADRIAVVLLHAKAKDLLE